MRIFVFYIQIGGITFHAMHQALFYSDTAVTLLEKKNLLKNTYILYGEVLSPVV